MISVIIPLYNKEPIIERSLQSVLTQDYDDFEVIVVNDGSTDKSAEIVKSINDSRINLIEQENGGPSKARNTGIKHAKGDWILFLDADDELLSGALKTFYEKTLEHPNINMFCGEVLINKKKKKSYQEGCIRNIYKSLFYNVFYPCSGSSIFSKSLCDKHLYNENIRRYEDLECLFRKYKNNEIFILNSPVANVNTDYAAASRGRQDINEDFIGHLDFKGKSFWEKMCLYKLYLGEREHYPEQIDKLYPLLRYRYDLLLLYKILNLFSK